MRLALPVDFLWKPTQSSLDDRWCCSSHRRKSAGDLKYFGLPIWGCQPLLCGRHGWECPDVHAVIAGDSLTQGDVCH